MEGHELLAKMTKVTAPAGFEEGVWTRLPAARKERARARRTAFRFAFAGSAAVVLAGFFLLNPSLFERETVLTFAEREALTATPGKGARVPSADRGRFVPVYETDGLPVRIPERPIPAEDGLHTGAGFRVRISGNHLLGGCEGMNKMIKPALVIMASLAVLASSFGAETAAAKATGSEPDIADIAKKVFPSVVRVEVQNHTRRVATGVVIEKGGYVVTTALISPRDEKITITTSDGKTMDAEFLGLDTETQLALLKAKDADLPALALGKPADLAPGSWICVIGVSPERTAAVTQGIVSSVAEDKLRLNVWVTPGSSGGPVVDAGGRMVGLLRGIYMEEKPVVFQFRDREQAGCRLCDEQPGRGALVGHGPGRSGGCRQGRRRPDQGEGQGRARLAGRRHRPRRETAGPSSAPSIRKARPSWPSSVKATSSSRSGTGTSPARTCWRPRSGRGSRARKSPSRSSGTASPWTSRSSSASSPKTRRSRRWTSASLGSLGRAAPQSRWSSRSRAPREAPRTERPSPRPTRAEQARMVLRDRGNTSASSARILTRSWPHTSGSRKGRA